MPETNPTIERINELAKIARQRELTPEEYRERQRLRAEYLKNFRSSFRSQLDNTYVQRDDGARVPLREWHEAVREDAEGTFEPEK